MQLMFRNDGQPTQLGARLTQGGQGGIYLVEGEPHLLAKVYHNLQPLAQQHKLRNMTRPLNPDLADHCAWPLHTLHLAAHGPAHGFLMRRFDGYAPLHLAYDPASCRTHFPSATWALHARGALALAQVVAAFHAHGHVIGDLNPNNCLINPASAVVLVDCDSQQISGNGNVYPCAVAMPEFCAPELHFRLLERVVRGPAHDAYSLALLIFHMLMMGHHPFAANEPTTHEPDLIEAMRAGRFAFAPLTPSDDLRIDLFAQLPAPVQNAFAQTFTQHQASAKRPSAREWVALLQQLNDGLITCERDATHVHTHTARECPWCKTETRGAQFFAPPVTPPRAHFADVATAATAVKHALRNSGLPKPREFSEPLPAPPRRAVRVAAWRSRLPILRGSARKWLAAQHTLAQQAALKWHLARQSYVDTVQYRNAQRALADCQTRINQWERDTNARLLRAKQSASGRECLARELPEHALATNRLPLLNPQVLALLAQDGIHTAQDVTEHSVQIMAQHSQTLALVLWNWREALERVICAWHDSNQTTSNEANRARLNMEREIVFNAERAFAQLDRAHLAEAEAAEDVREADAQYSQVLGELPYLADPSTQPA